jgi:hypothetical protein
VGLFSRKKAQPLPAPFNVRAHLNDDETYHASLPGTDVGLGCAPCQIFITDQRLVWVLHARPDVPMNLYYEDFIGLGINWASRDLAFEAKRRPLHIRGYSLPAADDSSLLGGLRFDASNDAVETQLVDQSLEFVSRQASPHCTELGDSVFQKVSAQYER